MLIDLIQDFTVKIDIAALTFQNNIPAALLWSKISKSIPFRCRQYLEISKQAIRSEMMYSVILHSSQEEDKQMIISQSL